MMEVKIENTTDVRQAVCLPESRANQPKLLNWCRKHRASKQKLVS